MQSFLEATHGTFNRARSRRHYLCVKTVWLYHGKIISSPCEIYGFILIIRLEKNFNYQRERAIDWLSEPFDANCSYASPNYSQQVRRKCWLALMWKEVTRDYIPGQYQSWHCFPWWRNRAEWTTSRMIWFIVKTLINNYYQPAMCRWLRECSIQSFSIYDWLTISHDLSQYCYWRIRYAIL